MPILREMMSAGVAVSTALFFVPIMETPLMKSAYL
jgi:hypothetical protein